MRQKLATMCVRSARSIGRLLGTELVVEQSEHDIELSMEIPDRTKRAWDSDMFHRGQMYVSGYANPIKFVTDHNPGIVNKDVVEATDGDVDDVDIEDDTDTSVISSDRYRQFMVQNLISQLLNPKEQWDKLVYGLIGIAVLQFMTMIVLLWATGSF